MKATEKGQASYVDRSTSSQRRDRKRCLENDKDLLRECVVDNIGSHKKEARKVIRHIEVDPSLAKKTLEFMEKLKSGEPTEICVPVIKAFSNFIGIGFKNSFILLTFIQFC